MASSPNGQINRRIRGITRAYGSKIIARSLSAIEALRENPQTLEQLKEQVSSYIRTETDQLGRMIADIIPSDEKDKLIFTNLENRTHV